MQEITLDQIREYAVRASDAKEKWHFHILTPTCYLNDSKQYAFILEIPHKAYVHYSDKIEKKLDKELVALLHGKKVLHKETIDSIYEPSETVKKMVAKAKELNQRGIEWHHHMLFPNCNFNQDRPKWALLLESSQDTEVLKNLSDEEPLNDLKQIESLF